MVDQGTISRKLQLQRTKEGEDTPTGLANPSTPAINGWIGTITHDSSLTYYTTYAYFSPFTPTTAGNVRYAHAYVVDGNAKNICISLCDATDGTGKLYGCDTMGDPGTGWINIDCGSWFTLVADHTYWLVWRVSGTVTMGRNDATGTFIYRDDTLAGYACELATIEISSTPSTGLSVAIVFDNQSGDPT